MPAYLSKTCGMHMCQSEFNLVQDVKPLLTYWISELEPCQHLCDTRLHFRDVTDDKIRDFRISASLIKMECIFSFIMYIFVPVN